MRLDIKRWALLCPALVDCSSAVYNKVTVGQSPDSHSYSCRNQFEQDIEHKLRKKTVKPHWFFDHAQDQTTTAKHMQKLMDLQGRERATKTCQAREYSEPIWNADAHAALLKLALASSSPLRFTAERCVTLPFYCLYLYRSLLTYIISECRRLANVAPSSTLRIPYPSRRIKIS